MGFRIQRSKKIAPGVRLNMSKSGFGISVGKPGTRVSINPKGEVKTTVGIPGTGISHSQKVGQIRKDQATKITPKPTQSGQSKPIITPFYFWLYAVISVFGCALIGVLLTSN